jgi:5'-methylthioadenosine phosphorylase
MSTKIGLIGGSGIYDLSFIKKNRTEHIETPFGLPSSEIDVAEYNGKEIYFIARHGKKHEFPAHVVNYRANIYAFKKLGVDRIISVQTVGSLKEEYKPGYMIIPDQFIDFTKKRDYSYFNGGRSLHVSLADPFCPQMREASVSSLHSLGIPYIDKGTYIAIEGPRFSTRAESRYFMNFGDVIGMTLVPEVILAREMEICYLSISMITDYDAWKVNAVTAEEIVTVMKNNINKAYILLEHLIPSIPDEYSCKCHEALKHAEV